MKRLTDGRTVAVWNPVPYYNGRTEPTGAAWGRTPLVLAVSQNDGRSFFAPRIIEDDPMRGYAYTAIHECADGAVLLAYCAGDEADGNMLNRLRITRISPEFLK